MWASIIGAASTTIALDDIHKHYKEAQMESFRLEMRLAEQLAKYKRDTKKAVTTPRMCPCCHSREFKYHHQRLICSYCRTGV